MRHRGPRNKVKRVHHMIPGLRAFLDRTLHPLAEIKAIIPGRIERRRGSSNALSVRYQYATDTGAKLIARSAGAVQEVFAVTCKPATVRKALEKNCAAST